MPVRMRGISVLEIQVRHLLWHEHSILGILDHETETDSCLECFHIPPWHLCTDDS